MRRVLCLCLLAGCSSVTSGPGAPKDGPSGVASKARPGPEPLLDDEKLVCDFLRDRPDRQRSVGGSQIVPMSEAYSIKRWGPHDYELRKSFDGGRQVRAVVAGTRSNANDPGHGQPFEVDAVFVVVKDRVAYIQRNPDGDAWAEKQRERERPARVNDR